MKKIFGLFLVFFYLSAFGTTTSNPLYTGIPGGGSIDCTSGTAGQLLKTDGTVCSFITASGTGTVTSVNTDSTTSSIFANTVNVIGTTTATITLSSQSANVVLIGPTSSTAAPTFRSLVAGDLPTVTVAKGGTNSTTALNSNRFMISSGGAIVEASAVTASRVVVSDTNGLPTASTVSSSVLTDSLIRGWDGFIEAATAKVYKVVAYAPVAGTINKAWFETVSGTLTAAVKINTTAVTSLSAVSVSGTGASTSATGANTFSAGDQITVTVSSPSTPVDFAFSINYTVN